jgi:hypothetical protein
VINKYYFQHFNLLVAIYAKDLEDAFVPYKRLKGNFKLTQSDFEKDLIEPEDTSDHCILIGNGITKEETLRIINTKKSSKIVIMNEKVPKKEAIETVRIIEYVDAPEEIAKAIQEGISVTIEDALGDGYKNLPVVKRGRGRPPGSKNKTVSIQNYFEE